MLSSLPCVPSASMVGFPSKMVSTEWRNSNVPRSSWQGRWAYKLNPEFSHSPWKVASRFQEGGIIMPYYLEHPIQIADYDPQWPHLYAQEKQRLQAALGSVLLAIEHIGSTAVPGLAAKPIIDILAGVTRLEDISEYVPALQCLGYEDARINPVFQRLLFCKGPYNEGSHHLHFVIYGSDPWLLPLR